MSKENRLSSSSTAAGEDIGADTLENVFGFLNLIGIPEVIPTETNRKHFISDFVDGLLQIDRVERGHVSCLLSVKPASTNAYGGMHGGAVSSVAEMVSTACARTVVGQEGELFLGELSISYLSAAPRNAELRVDAFVTRSGRNLTVVAVEFKLKDSGKLTYTSRVTFYNKPISSL